MQCISDTNKKMRALIIGFLLVFSCTTVGAEHHVVLVHNYTIVCDPSETNCNSTSLESIASELDELVDAQIVISTAYLQLATTVNFTQLSSLNITGSSNSTTINCTGSNAGFRLVHITQLALKHLTITHCGVKTKSRFNRIYISALAIDHSKNVTITDVVIAQSRGTGLTIFRPQGSGTVVIRSTIFRENILPEGYKNDKFLYELVHGGGGIFIGSIQENKSNISFEFDQCIFENNTAHTRYYDYLYTNNRGIAQKGYGRGGGAYLSLRDGISNVNVVFSQCNFTKNMAFIGGGLSVKIGGGPHQKTENITVEIKDSIFSQNGCNHSKRATGFGGGAHLNFNAFNGSKIINSHYIIRNVSFTNNCAQVGGGVLYFSSRYNLSDISNSVLFDNCKFMRNRAHLGSAVNMMPHIFQRQSTGHATKPRFQDCWFSENTVFVNQSQSRREQRTAGVGTVYASLYDIYFEGHNCFENNWGSAVYVVNGMADFTKSTAYFINNTGLNGGAVALIGVSLMKVGTKEYRFENNTALFKGGAIYVFMIDNNDFTTSRSCFIQNDNNLPLSGKWSSEFTFVGNKAKDNTNGNAIFSTSLTPCTVVNNGTVNQPDYSVIDITEVFSARGIPVDLEQVSTEGTNLVVNTDSIWQIVPGEQYSHRVTVKDDLKHDVDVSLRVLIADKTKDVDLNPALSAVIGKKIQLVGEPGQKANITLQTMSPQQAYIRTEVELLNCPPGFKLYNKSCSCNFEAYVALYKCNLESFHTHLVPGFWAGMVSDSRIPNKSELVTTICPFCDYRQAKLDSSGVILPRNATDLDEHVCGKTRTGTLCGSCRENYTVHFHSPNFLCKPVNKELCKMGWLFYILSELLPVTIVFIVVLIFNINFTSGAINGFILFSQVVNSLDIDASGIIRINLPEGYQHTLSYITQVYQVIYGFFNLDFFNSESLSFCLWNGASALDMLAIKYATILYTLLLIVVLVCMINNCRGNCLGKYCRITTIKTSVTHGISTFLVMCYAQCIRVSLDLLISIELYVAKGSNLRPGTRVWYDGRMHYFSKEHLPYALPAIFCLFTVGLLPPILLLMYPLLNKILDAFGFEDDSKIYALSRKLPINSFKPLLDSFQGCFKDNLRFFAGLYFLYRWPILLVYMNSTSFSTFYITVGSIFAIILAIHAISQPYVKRAHNIIDALLLTDLILINGMSFFNYYQTRLNKNVGGAVDPTILQMFLIYLPLVIMGIYLSIILYKYLHKKGCRADRRSMTFVPKRARKLRELVQSISALEDDSDHDYEEELPHRLQAGEINYSYFEDSD